MPIGYIHMQFETNPEGFAPFAVGLATHITGAPSTGERIVGKEKITEYFRQIFASASRLTINPESDRSDSSGDLGFDGGHYEETVVTGGGGTVIGRGAVIGRGTIIGGGGGGTQSQRQGAYLVVLKRQTGKWLIVQQATTEIPQTGK